MRREEEWRICHIEGALLIPVNELVQRLHELDSGRDILVLCKTGPRSVRAAALLREAGFRNVQYVRGGIQEWAQTIDSSMPVY